MFTIVHGKHIEFNEWMDVCIFPDRNPRPRYTVDQCTHIQERDPRPGYTVDQCTTILEQDPRPRYSLDRCISIPVPECTLVL